MWMRQAAGGQDSPNRSFAGFGKTCVNIMEQEGLGQSKGSYASRGHAEMSRTS